MGLLDQLGRIFGRAARDTLQRELRRNERTSTSSRRHTRGTRPTQHERTEHRQASEHQAHSGTASTNVRDYPGDFRGRPNFDYDPQPDGRPDPGEVVWTWVPFEEDHSQGKDRPVLLIGQDPRTPRWLLGLPLTSKDHDRDADQEASAGRHWLDVGTGTWDAQRRPSEVRLDRIIRVDPLQVRRSGDGLPEATFAAVQREVLRLR